MSKKIRDVVAWMGVGMAALLGLLGQVITFVPGTQMAWFAVVAALATAGLISPRSWFRFIAIVLMIALVLLSWAGYLEGLRYQEFLRQR